MANKKDELGKEVLEFTERLLKVHDHLPADYEKRVLEKLPQVNINRIRNVRYNRTRDFEILEIFEELAAEEQNKSKE
jgi:hypothetical protein